MTITFYACNAQTSNEECQAKFKRAKKLTYAYPNPVRQSALDSALVFVNESLLCDSNIRKAAVELKITLLITQKKYSEGVIFIDSLVEEDFTFKYKKKMMKKNFLALNFNSKYDTINRNLVYLEMANELEQYIRKEDISEKEFNEIFVELYDIKRNFLNVNQIKHEIDSLKGKYPNKIDFFSYLY